MKTHFICFMFAICGAYSALADNFYWTGAAPDDGNNFWNAANWVVGSVDGPVASRYPEDNDFYDDLYFTDHPGLVNKTVSGWSQTHTVNIINSVGWDLDFGFLSWGFTSSGNGTNNVKGWCKTAGGGMWSTVEDGNTIVFSTSFCVEGNQGLYISGSGTIIFSDTPYAAWGWSYITLHHGSLVRVENPKPMDNMSVYMSHKDSRYQYMNTVANAEWLIEVGYFVDNFNRKGFTLSARDIGDGYVEIYFKPPPFTLLVVK